MIDEMESVLANNSINNSSNMKSTVTDIDVKESELRQAVRNRITLMEQQLASRDNELLRLQARLQTIEEDYQFNYNLIKERDAALHEASTEITKLQEEITAIALQSDALNNKWHDAEQLISTLRKQIEEVEADRDRKLATAHDTYAKELKCLQLKMETDRHEWEEELTRREKWYHERLCECESSQGKVNTTQKEYMQRIQESHEAEVRRLRNELENVTSKYHETSEALHALEMRKHQLAVELEAVQKENGTLQEKISSNEKERAQERSVHAEQIEMLHSEMHETTHVLESALKEESSRARQLERESNKWQKELCEVQESMHRLTLQCEEEQQKILEQLREHDARCLQMHMEMSKLKQLHDKSNAALQADVSKNAHELMSLQEEITHKNEEIENYRQSLNNAHDKYVKAEAELQLCKCEVERFKEEAHHLTILSEKGNTTWSSQCQQLSESLRESNAQLHEVKVSTNMKIEQLQSETLRLTRELHSSEAARRVLEDQLHLSCDVNAQTAELQTLRHTNELLQRQVVELTSANEEIRSQIGHFTSELQNDPLILSAKQNQQELQQVQQELLHTRDEILRLKDSVRSKDEEINRYQLDLLKLQMLQPSHKNNALHTPHHSHELSCEVSLHSPYDNNHHNSNNAVVNHKFVQKIEYMYKSLREDYDKLRAELHQERQQREKEEKLFDKEQGKTNIHEQEINKSKGNMNVNADNNNVTSQEKGNITTIGDSVNNKNISSTSSSSSLSSEHALIHFAESKNNKRQSGNAKMSNSEHQHDNNKTNFTTSHEESDFTVSSTNLNRLIGRMEKPKATDHCLSRHEKRSHNKHDYTTNEEDALHTQETSTVMNEAELWRRKYFVLEHHVRALLREREKLQRELRQSKHEIATLRSEKESLIEINSLLKAQVREAYKLHTHHKTTNELFTGKNEIKKNSDDVNKNNKIEDEANNSESEECYEIVQHRHSKEAKENLNLLSSRVNTNESRERQAKNTNINAVDGLANGKFDAYKARELLASAMHLLEEEEEENANKNEVQEQETREDKLLEPSEHNYANAKASFVEKTLKRRLYNVDDDDEAKQDYYNNNKNNDSSNNNNNLCSKQEWSRHRAAIVAPTSLHSNRQIQEKQQQQQQHQTSSNHVDNNSRRSTSQQRVNSAIPSKSAMRSTLHGYRNAISKNTSKENATQVANAKEIQERGKDNNITELSKMLPRRQSALPFVASKAANVTIANKSLNKNNKPTVVRRGGQVVRHYGFE